MNPREALKAITVSLTCITVTAYVLSRFAILIQHLLRIHYDWRFELLMVTGQLLFQLPFILKFPLIQKLDYFLNMLLISFMGSVLLAPLLILNHYSRMGDIFNLGWFFSVVLFMFVVHRHRVKVLQMPFYISYTWVLYRALILLFIV